MNPFLTKIKAGSGGHRRMESLSHQLVEIDLTPLKPMVSKATLIYTSKRSGPVNVTGA